jgi:hypothetical protein
MRDSSGRFAEMLEIGASPFLNVIAWAAMGRAVHKATLSSHQNDEIDKYREA